LNVGICPFGNIAGNNSQASLERPGMAIELFNPNHIGADLYCDGLGDSGDCILGEDGPAMVSDYAGPADDARRMVLYSAESSGWAFDLKLQRWLCPDCLAARGAQAS
jgi:hypothetical protein